MDINWFIWEKSLNWKSRFPNKFDRAPHFLTNSQQVLGLKRFDAVICLRKTFNL